ncbi:MAG: transposase, partial [Deltaproteobacteria bacterium]|nr:transposase [Deltaproteobacteria bacterium]
IGPRLVDKGLFGPGFLAHILTAKFADHQPLYRIRERFKREDGVDLGCSTLVDWVGVARLALSPIAQRKLLLLVAPKGRLPRHCSKSKDNRVRELRIPLTVDGVQKFATAKGAFAVVATSPLEWVSRTPEPNRPATTIPLPAKPADYDETLASIPQRRSVAWTVGGFAGATLTTVALGGALAFKIATRKPGEVAFNEEEYEPVDAMVLFGSIATLVILGAGAGAGAYLTGQYIEEEPYADYESALAKVQRANAANEKPATQHRQWSSLVQGQGAFDAAGEWTSSLSE